MKRAIVRGEEKKLEQLRWLRVALTDIETIGIDTPNDFAKAEAYIQSQQQ